MAVRILVINPPEQLWPLVMELRSQGVAWNFDVIVMTNMISKQMVNGIKLLPSLDSSWEDNIYIGEVLTFCKLSNINLVIPFVREQLFHEHEDKFKQISCEIYYNISELRSQVRFTGDALSKLSKNNVKVHQFNTFSSLDEFDTAKKGLKTNTFVQLKVGGQISELWESNDKQWDFFDSQSTLFPTVSIASIREYIKRQSNDFEGVLISQETKTIHVIDILGYDGILITHVDRVHEGVYQRTQITEQSYELARKVAEIYQLNGIMSISAQEDSDGNLSIFNVDSGINPGVVFSTKAGISFLCASVIMKLKLADISSIPEASKSVSMTTMKIPFEW